METVLIFRLCNAFSSPSVNRHSVRALAVADRALAVLEVELRFHALLHRLWQNYSICKFFMTFLDLCPRDRRGRPINVHLCILSSVVEADGGSARIDCKHVAENAFWYQAEITARN